MSSVNFANEALVKLGASTIDSFGDDSTESIVVSAMYDTTKKAFLASYRWNCAIKRASLTAHTDTPTNGYDHQHILPDDYLRVADVYVGTNRYPPEREYNGYRGYSIEGKKLLSNHAEISIAYVANIPETWFTPHVKEAFIAKLSLELSYTLNASNTSQVQFAELFNAKLNEARTIDALENPATVTRTDSLIRVRY